MLFTDIVNSSEKWAKHENKMLEILKEHEKRMFIIGEKNSGVIIKTIGDSFMISFNNLKDSIKCAIDIQEDLNENPLKLDKDNIKLRIGMCEGYVFEKNINIQNKTISDLFGNTVNSASRIETKVSKEDGFAFASLLNENEKLDDLVKNYNVEVIDFNNGEDNEVKRSGRLLTDIHRHISKSLEELKGIRKITVYSCFL